MSIVATNLNFRYPGANKDVLHGINLTILPGTTLAIVGLNGSGKTTLTKALMGLYEHQGSLLLNGRPITAYDPATIHRRTSCLFQDFCRYSFTLRENVGIGNVDQMAEDTALEIAMDRGGALGIKEKVGLEGKLNRYGSGGGEGEDENTASLSGGQWQRVALSRSFMRASEADLVIFDEPSASLDPKAEAQLFDRIHALSRQNGRRCTTIYISHRFSTGMKADQIAVVEDGTITECGPHAELMAKAGRYAELYNIQKAGFEE
ncbi:P-loop containing nucleoside triphosphate hydrolase protein [Dioszegia hungarica]|uniref:P-loop containing nucleoside triphosphate hydrolase protein n=1 Tax=Dioszegia hungarica TaxID=4972 RepID=A0AA38H376_9TREE|nr:P-loop containing nucleoside triphosphate hydrolase protein [Dioszegia hungarica]KAI9633142.1 P-loop containing nucleoside triphosphate hydrolase protein [Dioszegia hungarica]